MFRNWEVGWHECVVQASRKVPRFISICIGYPGVSAASATGREVAELLRREGLRLEANPGFSPFRKASPVFNQLSNEQQKELIAQDSRYGHVVCRCETVTEGEIVEAVRRGATTLDGIKFRTRAGMGRCQGGFCTPRVVKILGRELGLPEDYEFHFSKNSHRVRLSFLRAITPYPFFYHGFVLNKHPAKLFGEGFKHKESLYKYVCRLVLTNARPFLHQATIVIDKSGDRRFRQQLAAYLRKHVEEEGRQVVKKVKMERSSTNNLLQLADYVAGVVNRRAEGKHGASEYQRYLATHEISLKAWPK